MSMNSNPSSDDSHSSLDPVKSCDDDDLEFACDVDDEDADLEFECKLDNDDEADLDFDAQNKA